MFPDDPLKFSQLFLSLLGTRINTHYRDRVPQDGAILVIGNHRSFMDAPLLMSAIKRPIRFACHHYMGEVPIMREVITKLGCFPLGAPDQRQQSFFHKAGQLLESQQTVGVFPEGAQPMVQPAMPEKVGDFQRGFAHLALRAQIANLAILPVAIASHQESTNAAIPLRMLNLVDPSEPLFDQPGWHPMIVYQHVSVLIGRPYWIRSSQRADYQGKQARSLVTEITNECHAEIDQLLAQGCY
ncbi:1-acyl-sn-glycerol-3-phosphate acyltransferase [Phormidium sp. CLA17]|uniref:lysophospholipid acyltransferase family protein n=1 Tax=Leptolyngbya sp. Cla-17 TaxID=2803751 RepID=UPI0014931139|nr:lysophospholipid acyltransferase family protein [Leptolyngbya sp. Cla-17]MBM0743260.1 1-acyl-sn-glycerol-3-phosphate acyltransferase [Leptolyngbya sp. Cla-17]